MECPSSRAGSNRVAVTDSGDVVTFYWRPGCPFCILLRRDLRRAGIATNELNIWEDPQAAAAVRRIASGNETVPTVVVRGVGLVNPRVDAVREALGVDASPGAPGARAPDESPRTARLRAVQWLLIAAMVTASFALDAGGHGNASWAIDGAALAAYAAFRLAGRRLRRR